MDDEVVDIGENEHPKSSISPVTIEKDLVLGNSNGIFSLACLYCHSYSLWKFCWRLAVAFFIFKFSGPQNMSKLALESYCC